MGSDMRHAKRANLHSATRPSVTRDVFALIIVVLAGLFGLYAMGEGNLGLFSADRASSDFWLPGKSVSNTAIHGHMWVGGLITILAPVQAMGFVRNRFPWIHRALGYFISITALATAVGGLFYIAARGTQGGIPMSLAFTLYGLLMVLAAVQTLRHARAGWPTLRDWALRLIVLILGSWLYRVHYGVWYLITGGIASNPDFNGLFDLVSLFAFYVPYLILLELWLRRRPSAT